MKVNAEISDATPLEYAAWPANPGMGNDTQLTWRIGEVCSAGDELCNLAHTYNWPRFQAAVARTVLDRLSI